MSIQILPENQNLASSFGQGLGQGVSQQLPEEIKRYRIKSGLENLGNQQNASPFQIYSQLASIPGLDPGLLGVLAPALEQQIQRNEQQRVEPQNKQIGNQPFGQETNLQNDQLRTSTQPGIASNQDRLAREYSKILPFTYRTPQLAEAKAKQVENDFNEKFDKKLKAYTGKETDLLGGDIGGKTVELMRQQGLNKLSPNGKSGDTLASEYADKALKIARNYQKFATEASKVGPIHQGTENLIKGTRAIVKELQNDEVPQDQIIDQIMSRMSISKDGASYLSNFGENTKADKYLSGYKPISFAENIVNKFNHLGKNSAKAQAVKLAKDLAPLLTKYDEIGRISYIAREKGIDVNELFSNLQDLVKPNQLDPEQMRDLGEQRNNRWIRPLNELWILGGSGERKKAGKQS